MIRTEYQGRIHAKDNHGQQAPPGKSRFRSAKSIDQLIDDTKQEPSMQIDDAPQVGMRKKFKKFRHVGIDGQTGRTVDWVCVIEDVDTGATQTAYPVRTPR
jgi:hypothetical protein